MAFDNRVADPLLAATESFLQQVRRLDIDRLAGRASAWEVRCRALMGVSLALISGSAELAQGFVALLVRGVSDVCTQKITRQFVDAAVQGRKDLMRSHLDVLVALREFDVHDGDVYVNPDGRVNQEMMLQAALENLRKLAA
jgi:hypothetical protein